MVVKYFRLFRTELSHLKEYQVDFLGEYIRIPLQIGLLYLLWSLVFSLSGAETLGGLTLPQFVFYIGMAAFVRAALPAQDASMQISDMILKGNTLLITTRPVRFIPYFFARKSADFLAKGFIGVVVFGIAGVALGWYVPSLWYTPLLFAVSLFLAMVLQFFVMMTFASLAFFIYAIWGIRNFSNTLLYFFSGELIPLTLFPPWLSAIASVLPFKYVVFVPLFIYLERFGVAQVFGYLGLQLVFIGVFMALSTFIVHKGLRSVDSQGG